ncbi:MAG TPA: sugar-transfer associated ATP-grasp domain-containing protein [Methylovirgula sp.]
MTTSAALKKNVPAGATVVTERQHEEAMSLPVLMRIGEATGMNPTQVVKDFASLAFGPGKASFNDYIRLRLFDQAYWEGDRRNVIGQRRNRDLVVEINYRHDWYGLLDDKVASTAYLSAYGLATAKIAAVFAPRLRNGAKQILRDREQLARFLMSDEAYPLFGKPADGFQSLGSVALRRPHPEQKELETIDGARIGLNAFLDDIMNHYDGGYIFEHFLMPHEDTIKLHGERLGTIRVLTLLDDGARILRASWKIPAGTNMADNFWRAGNILAKIDLAKGEIGRAVSGAGFETTILDRHPDTGAALVGAPVPGWDELSALALEGARLMRHVPLIGWDIAPTVDGPVIVEMNETPDLFLNQFAHARGILEPEFLDCVAAQKRARQAHETKIKTDLAKL